MKKVLKKKLFGTFQQNISFILGLIFYSYIIYLNIDEFLDLFKNGPIFLFFVAFPFFITFAVICVVIHKLINSFRHYKRDWRILLLYSVFIISFLSNKDITKIDDPYFPNITDIKNHLLYLSLCQFTGEEMSSGYAWSLIELLQGENKPNKFSL